MASVGIFCSCQPGSHAHLKNVQSSPVMGRETRVHKGKKELPSLNKLILPLGLSTGWLSRDIQSLPPALILQQLSQEHRAKVWYEQGGLRFKEHTVEEMKQEELRDENTGKDFNTAIGELLSHLQCSSIFEDFIAKQESNDPIE